MKYNDYDVIIPKQFRLEKLFAAQKVLMEKYNIKIKNINTKAGQQQLRDCGMCLFEEIGEIFHCLKNKAWTQSDTEVDIAALHDEVADVTHFFIELMILLNITPHKLTELYLKKWNANLDRIKSKY